MVKKVRERRPDQELHHWGKSPDVFPTRNQLRVGIMEYIQRRDMWRRRQELDLPMFFAGSLLRVTYSDPFHPAGVTSFSGVCMAVRRKLLGSNFVLRNHVGGHSLEKTFETYSPFIRKIEVLKLQRTRRSKLYYLRKKLPKFYTFKDGMKAKPLPPGVEPTDRNSTPVMSYRKGF